MLGPRGILNLVRASHSQTSISKGGMYMRTRDAGLIQPKANHKMWVNCIFRDAVSVWPVRRFPLLRFHGVLCSGIFSIREKTCWKNRILMRFCILVGIIQFKNLKNIYTLTSHQRCVMRLCQTKKSRICKGKKMDSGKSINRFISIFR